VSRQQLDDLVCLVEVGAARAQLGPQVSDRVEPDDVGAAADIRQEYFHDSCENVGVFVVEVDLVGGEGGPEELRAPDGLEASEDVGCAGSEDCCALLRRKLFGGIEGDEEIAIISTVVQELLEPAALGGDMVDDAVEHELVVGLELLDVLPGAELGVDRLEVDDRESPVG